MSETKATFRTVVGDGYVVTTTPSEDALVTSVHASSVNRTADVARDTNILKAYASHLSVVKVLKILALWDMQKMNTELLPGGDGVISNKPGGMEYTTNVPDDGTGILGNIIQRYSVVAPGGYDMVDAIADVLWLRGYDVIYRADGSPAGQPLRSDEDQEKA